MMYHIDRYVIYNVFYIDSTPHSNVDISIPARTRITRRRWRRRKSRTRTTASTIHLNNRHNTTTTTTNTNKNRRIWRIITTLRKQLIPDRDYMIAGRKTPGMNGNSAIGLLKLTRVESAL